MGVTGLWTVVAPTARPTKLETLNRKRLAVDASIWIYQFLKAVRDKEGNALRNSHVVGFFRRICKLLYFGIKPVFVFDGGAPVLKRETIRGRVRRREGRREDAVRTAGKLLAVQVARVAEEEEKRRKEAERARPEIEEELPADQELVYVDEIGMDQQERQAGRSFKRKDQYHLPDLDVSIESLGAPNDPRIMSQAELEEYAKQFHSGEDINLYDFSKIDFESPFFLSLPAGDRYNILNAARLRSRLRMGYSKEQLDGMFPDRMAFSRFQIDRVKERNELTQRLMNINGMSDDSWNQGGRIVGEKGKEYVLVKNDGVEGGWALGVVSNKQGTKKEDAIDLDNEYDSDDDKPNSEDEDFEDVAIEGLNRIPKNWQRKKKELREVDHDVSYEDAAAQIARKRKAVYEGRRQAAARSKPVGTVAQAGSVNKAISEIRPAEDVDATENPLFIPEEKDDITSEDEDDLFEDVHIGAHEEEDDDLQKAIAMSLEQPEDTTISGGFFADEQPAADQPVSDDDEMDLAAALAESRKSKYQSKTNVRKITPPREAPPESIFSGPLPFESLNLGQSLLGRKKAKKVEEDLSGGFDRNAGDDAFRREKKAQPLPSWFDAAPDTRDQRELEEDSDDHVTYGREDVDRRETLMRRQTKEVIDLEAEEDENDADHSAVNIEVIEDEDDRSYGQLSDDEIIKDNTLVPDDNVDTSRDVKEMTEKEKATQEREARYKLAREIAAETEDVETRMEDIADQVQAVPPPPSEVPSFVPEPQFETVEPSKNIESRSPESVEWSESEEELDAAQARRPPSEGLAGDPSQRVEHLSEASVEQVDEDEDETFEDVEMPQIPAAPITAPPTTIIDEPEPDADYLIPDDRDNTDQPGDNINGGFDNYLSDSDEEVMRALAAEAEEHARFASSLNNTRTPAQAARDYEDELKQLRNQQKKDRRDADEVTQVMIQECQALLRLFGLPYITAPMEAEAQCAELVHLGLVDGIVTDDSDIFLFGGTRIYKNMFNASKFVECYISSDLEKEYALDRQKLIRFAHLLGSDYTEGIPGIGPVTALEIISDFNDLTEFKDWCAEIQLGHLSSDPQANLLTTSFRRKFKKTVQKKLFLPNSFPDLRVDQAYLQPDVDSSPDPFQWGVPDLNNLRSFLMTTIGWSQERMDEILVPVIRDMNQRGQEGTQSNITRFFSGGVGVGAVNAEGAAPRNRTGKESGRMKNAYTRLRGEARKKRGEDIDDDKTGRNGDRNFEVEIPDAETRDTVDVDADDTATTATSNGKRAKKGAKSKRKASSVARAQVDDGHEEDDSASDFASSSRMKRTKRRKTRSVDV